MKKNLLLLSFLLLLQPLSAYAYVGPGLGLGAIGVLFGIIAAVFMAILGVFWYPIKRMFKKKTDETLENSVASPEDSKADETGTNNK